MDQTIEDIESEMSLLYPKKEMAYLDYLDNTGDPDLSERFIDEFRAYRDRWNELVIARRSYWASRNLTIHEDGELLEQIKNVDPVLPIPQTGGFKS